MRPTLRIPQALAVWRERPCSQPRAPLRAHVPGPSTRFSCLGPGLAPDRQCVGRLIAASFLSSHFERGHFERVHLVNVLNANSRTLRYASAAVALDLLSSPKPIPTRARAGHARGHSPADLIPVVREPKLVAKSRRQNKPPLGGCMRPDPVSERPDRDDTPHPPRPPLGDRTRRHDPGNQYRFVSARASRQLQTLPPYQGHLTPPRAHSGSLWVNRGQSGPPRARRRTRWGPHRSGYLCASR